MFFTKHCPSCRCHEEKDNFFGFPGWLSSYFSRAMGGFFEPFARAIRERQEDMWRKMAAFLILILGWLFLLNGISLLISIAAGAGRWLGYIIVGLILLIIGLIKNKK